MRERLELPAMFRRQLMSWLGHARWGNTKGLVRRVIADIRKNIG
jgi:hypothetical protein